MNPLCLSSRSLGLLPLLSTLLHALAASGQTPPSNLYENRIRVFGSETNFVASNQGATKEACEKLVAAGATGATVWWVWQPPQIGFAVVSTVNSSLDTLLGVRLGKDVCNLNDVVANDDAPAGSRTSSVGFDASNHEDYQIVVDTKGATGEFELHIKLYTVPEMVEQPQSKSVPEQGDVTYRAVALGARPLSYQWQYRGVGQAEFIDLSGAASPDLSLRAVTKANQGTYRCVVRNSYDEVTSDEAELAVLAPPQIIPPLPVGGSAKVCERWCFSVKALGERPLRFQWQYRSSPSVPWLDHPDEGASTDQLCLSALTTSQSGEYRVVVSNAAGRDESEPVALAVSPSPPQIKAQPKDTVAILNESASLSAEATGCRLVSFQWHHRPPGSPVGSQTPVFGADQPVIIFDPVASEHAGFYSLEVTDEEGSLTLSREAALTVEPRPPNDHFVNRFLIPPVERWVTNGFNKHGTIESGEPNHRGSPPLHSVWWTYSTNAQGVGTIDLTGTKFAPRLALYTGPTVSNLTAITSAGNLVRFPVYAAIEYQIGIDGTTDPQQGDITLTFEFKEAKVTDPPQWISEPNGFTEIGDYRANGGGCRDRSLAGEAVSILPVDYSWLFNGSPIPGAIAKVLPLPRVSVEDAGSYQLVARNPGGAVTSRVAQVTIIAEPRIVQQPLWQPSRAEPFSLCSTARVDVAAESCSPMIYQWRLDGQVVLGATNPSLNLLSISPVLAGNYDVIIRNQNGAVTSQVTTLSVDALPAITRAPQKQTYQLCDTLNLAFNPSGCDSPLFQWLRNGEALPGASGPSLRLGPLLPDDAGSYELTIQLGSTTVTSRVVSVSVNALPVITQQPANLNVRDCAPGRFCVQVGASLCAPLRFQWFSQRTGRSAMELIPGATDSCLDLERVSIGDAGAYLVEIANDFASVRSQAATLTVDARPVIAENPINQRVRSGDSFTNKIAATSCSPLSFHWERDGKPVIADATHEITTNGWLIVRSATRADSGAYLCLVSNMLSGVSSSKATIRVVTPPPNDHFVNRIALQGTNVTATTYADGELYHNELATLEPGEPRHADLTGGRSVWWTWTAPTPGRVTLDLNGSRTFSGQPLDTLIGVYTGSSVDRLIAMAADDNGGSGGTSKVVFLAARGRTFHIAIDGKSAAEGNIQINLSEEEIISPPLIRTQPSSLAATNGETAVFTVVAEGSPDLLYQWTKDGLPIPAATNSTLILTNVQATDEANYRVTISNEYPPPTNSYIARLTFGAIIRGQVTDATNDEPIPDARVSVGELYTLTDQNGNYELVGVQPGELRADFWAVKTRVGLQEFVQLRDNSTLNAVSLRCEKRPEYIDFEDTQFEPVRGQSVTNKISMSPVLTGMRFVLNWGLEPADLDAILLLKTDTGAIYQNDYLLVNKGKTNSEPYVTFDKDVQKSYGPETITLHRTVPGTYRLYVKKFNEAARGSLPTSHAAMRIYEYDPVLDQNRQVGTLNVPTLGTGSYWYVCDVDGATRNVTWLNYLTNQPPGFGSLSSGPGGQAPTSPNGPPPNLPPQRLALSGVEYFWQLGNGATSTNREPAIQYFSPGCYDIILTLTQHKDRRSFVTHTTKRCFIVVTNGPPQIRITWPPEGRIFRAGDPIPLEIAAEDTDLILAARKVVRVELFRIQGANTNLLQSLATDPYSWEFAATIERGTYTFGARATDDHGATAWTAPLSVDVRDLSGEILIIRNRDHPEIDYVERELQNMDIPFRAPQGTAIERRPPDVRILDQEGLHFDLVRGFRLIIWDDAGLESEGMTTNDVAVLDQAWHYGIPLYFIGEKLASDPLRFTEDDAREQWIKLVHLAPTNEVVEPGIIQFESAGLNDEVVLNELFHSGWYGPVTPFSYPRPLENTRSVGEEAQERATRNGAAVLVRTPPIGAIDAFEPRRLAQNFLVSAGEDQDSLEQRRTLLRNSVLWLLRNDCDNFSAQFWCEICDLNAVVGEDHVLQVRIDSNGRCPATGLLVSNVVSEAFEIIAANMISLPEGRNRGEIRRAGQTVIFGLAQLAAESAVILETTVRPRYSGRFTNFLTCSANYRAHQHVEQTIDVVGPPLRRPSLSYTISDRGLNIAIDQPALCTLKLEISQDFRTWHSFGPEFIIKVGMQTLPPIRIEEPSWRFFRLRCE